MAAAGQWTHPLSIAGYAVGAAILVLAAAVLLNIPWSFVASPQQAVVIIAGLMAIKVLLSGAHALIDRM